jgi:hypothetical protein
VHISATPATIATPATTDAGGQQPAPVKAELVLHCQPVIAGVVSYDHPAMHKITFDGSQQLPVKGGGGLLAGGVVGPSSDVPVRIGLG